MKHYLMVCLVLSGLTVLSSCKNDDDSSIEEPTIEEPNPETEITDLETVFDGRIDLNNLPNYANQSIPDYINKDNTAGNPITDIGATLGRVLFYDKKLSVDNTISCASCHQQEFAFGDPAVASLGVDGTTGRHAMRLINSRFGTETNFFWDERASTLEQQTTMPIQDHVEMGFSGQNGDPNIDDLIEKLSTQDYYKTLFEAAFGDPAITETRMQYAMAQFIRSIQSFDSKYDQGRAMVNNNNQAFPNFTQQENMGKNLFTAPSQFQGNTGNRIGGGLGCQGCHRAPEFDIDPNSLNNGVIETLNSADNSTDLVNTRSPSLRDIFDNNGEINGPLMHTGSFMTFEEVLDHYNDIQAAGNNNLDPRLARGGGQNLNMTDDEKDAIIAFIKTLSGSDIYTNEKWSDPF